MATKRRALLELYLTWDCNHPSPSDMSVGELDEIVAQFSTYIQEVFYLRRRTDTLVQSKFEIVAQKTAKIEPKGVATPDVVARTVETNVQRIVRQQQERASQRLAQEIAQQISTISNPAISQDSNGRWRRANGSFASIDEINAYRNQTADNPNTLAAPLDLDAWANPGTFTNNVTIRGTLQGQPFVLNNPGVITFEPALTFEEEAVQPVEMICPTCSNTAICYWGPDPYQSEINGDDTDVWECDDCRQQSAADI